MGNEAKTDYYDWSSYIFLTMTTRILREADLRELKEIHSRFYLDEFSFPDFANKFLGTFAIIDDDGSIITAGGLRTITECILITDKLKSPKIRQQALLQALATSSFVNSAAGYDQFHCWIKNDPSWERVLTRYGFRQTNGRALVNG
jgi:hypothetical protein